jgi:hypothetical protein
MLSENILHIGCVSPALNNAAAAPIISHDGERSGLYTRNPLTALPYP